MPLKSGRNIWGHCDLNSIFTWWKKKISCQLISLNERVERTALKWGWKPLLYLYFVSIWSVDKSEDFEVMPVAKMAPPQCSRVPYMPGSHHYERVTPILSLYHGIFTDLSIFWVSYGVHEHASVRKAWRPQVDMYSTIRQFPFYLLPACDWSLRFLLGLEVAVNSN